MKLKYLKKISVILFTTFIFFNFASISLATCTQDNAATCCAKTYSTINLIAHPSGWDQDGCNADPFCTMLSSYGTGGNGCAPKTSDLAKAQAASAAAAANQIISLQCPASSYPYTPNASQSVITGLIYNIFSSTNNLTTPQGCLNPRYDTKTHTCTTGTVAYDNDGNIMGCWVPPMQTIRNNTVTNLSGDANLSAVISPYKMKIAIPCNSALGINSQCPVADNPAGYIARLYQFGLMIVGFIALGAIIYGAALYTMSAGNMASKEEGKAWMLNAIYGILLLLGAYLVLYTINPSLVNLANPSLEKIDLDSFLPPATQVTDCSQIKPDYTNISQPCGANCQLDATTANGCSTNGSNNSVTETTSGVSGASGITGCLVSGSTGGMFGVNTSNNGQEVSGLSTSNSTMECTKCADGNDLVNGTCVCKTNLVRQPDGTCNASNLVLLPCPTGYAHDTNTTCNACAADYRKDTGGKCVIPTPVVPPMYCTSGYTGPDGKCLP